MKTNQEQFDVAVIGSGPAGMIAAGLAAEQGARVALIERNKKPGRKLLLTGKGRCNITQIKYDDQAFIEKIGESGKFLFSALSSFGPQGVINFFEHKQLKTKVERGGRVFPVTDKAQDVLAVMTKYLSTNNVHMRLGQRVRDLEVKNSKIEYIKTNSEDIYAKNFILCTGGKAYPTTGSTGDGYELAKNLGHTIIPPTPALVPIEIKDGWAKQLQGVGLKKVQINIFQDRKKIAARFGEMLFTHFGLSGPIILDASKTIGELLQKGKVFIEIDLKPALSFPILDKRLQRDFFNNSNKDFKNYLPDLLPKKMIPTMMQLSGIAPNKKLHSVTKHERKKLIHLLKNLKVEVKDLLGFPQAIITNGGIALGEIDPKTMRSKIISNLFFAGEVMDLDGPTGGFNLQICWSTGFVAGLHAGMLNKKEA